jgi:hypothetical protein
MNLKSKFLGLLIAGLGLIQLSYSQTPTDGLMMPKGEICIAVIYEDANWDKYWEGTYLRTNGNIGTFNRKMLMPMIIGGITDKINVIVSLPYVKTSAIWESKIVECAQCGSSPFTSSTCTRV